jgi:hypothetical protein
MNKRWLAVWLLLIPAVPLNGQEQPRIGFIVLPFQNETGFNGKWTIATEVPRFLSAYIKERYRIPTASSLLVLNFLNEQGLSEESLYDAATWRLLRDRFQIRYLVSGTLLAFDVSRFTVGTPNLGGYEAYKGEAALRFELFDLGVQQTSLPRSLTTGEIRGEYTDRSLALTLFGKPTERTVEFRDLDKIAFGSEEFNRTVIGQACVELSENLCSELESALPALKRLAIGTVKLDSLALGTESDTLSLRFTFITGFVMFLEGDRLFVNLGSEDGLRKGMVLLVYPQRKTPALTEEEVGTVEILEVRGPHLALAHIRSGKGKIRERDRVRVKVLN